MVTLPSYSEQDSPITENELAPHLGIAVEAWQTGMVMTILLIHFMKNISGPF